MKVKCCSVRSGHQYRIAYYLLIAGICFLAACSGQSVQTTSKTTAKPYDWSIELILCKECSPYKAENIPTEELESIKNQYLANFENGEAEFDSFRLNGFKIKTTYEAFPKAKTTQVTGAQVATIYLQRVVDQSQQKVPENSDQLQACTEERECISVSAGCCGCSSGGSAELINIIYYNYWNEVQSQSCKDVLCPAVLSNHSTCSAAPRCIDHKCQFENLP